MHLNLLVALIHLHSVLACLFGFKQKRILARDCERQVLRTTSVFSYNCTCVTWQKNHRQDAGALFSVPILLDVYLRKGCSSRHVCGRPSRYRIAPRCFEASFWLGSGRVCSTNKGFQVAVVSFQRDIVHRHPRHVLMWRSQCLCFLPHLFEELLSFCTSSTLLDGICELADASISSARLDLFFERQGVSFDAGDEGEGVFGFGFVQSTSFQRVQLAFFWAVLAHPFALHFDHVAVRHELHVHELSHRSLVQRKEGVVDERTAERTQRLVVQRHVHTFVLGRHRCPREGRAKQRRGAPHRGRRASCRRTRAKPTGHTSQLNSQPDLHPHERGSWVNFVVWCEAWSDASAKNTTRRNKNQKMECMRDVHCTDGAAGKSATRNKRRRARTNPIDVGVRKHGKKS